MAISYQPRPRSISTQRPRLMPASLPADPCAGGVRLRGSLLSCDSPLEREIRRFYSTSLCRDYVERACHWLFYGSCMINCVGTVWWVVGSMQYRVALST